MTTYVYTKLLSNWWSKKWAESKLAYFSAKELNAAYALLSEKGFANVVANGKGPIYCYASSLLCTKLRCMRHSPLQKQKILQIILADTKACDALRKGVMDMALWDKLYDKFFSPELTKNDELSDFSRVPNPEKHLYEAAALLCAAWLVNCDPALMFAWRGLRIYDELSIPRLPVKPLPSGKTPWESIDLPAPALAEQASPQVDRFSPENREIINRFAAKPWVRTWLENVLSPVTDLIEAAELAPRISKIEKDALSKGTNVTAVLETDSGPDLALALYFGHSGRETGERLETFFGYHKAECFALAEENTLSDALCASLSRILPGLLNGTQDELQDRNTPEAAALALRLAAVFSKYPRQMLRWRGFNALAFCGYLRRAKIEKQKPKPRKRRSSLWDDDYSLFSEPDDSYDYKPEPQLNDLKAPEERPALASDEPGSAEWAQQWLNSFGFLAYDDFAGEAKAALREGRVGEFVFAPRKKLIGCQITDEFGEKHTVTLHFTQFDKNDREMLGALMYSSPKFEEQIKEGLIGATLQQQLKDRGVKLLPDGYDHAEDREKGAESSYATAVLIKATQLLSADPLLLFKWRGINLQNEDPFGTKYVSGEALLRIAVNDPIAREFVGIFLKDPHQAPLAEAVKLLSLKRIGAPESEGKGLVSVTCHLPKGGKKTLSLSLKPFTCGQALSFADLLDDNYKILHDLARGAIDSDLKEHAADLHTKLMSGSLVSGGQDVTESANSDPLILAALIRLGQEIGKIPGLLFECRGLPVLSMPLGEIRMRLDGKEPEEPCMLPPAKKTDKYQAKALSNYESGFKKAANWWTAEWLRQAEEYSYCKVDDEARKAVKKGSVGRVRYLPNQHRLVCPATIKKETCRVYMNFTPFSRDDQDLVIDFFEKRPWLKKALEHGYLDRSFREYAEAQDLRLWYQYGERIGCDSKDWFSHSAEKGALLLQAAEMLEKNPALLLEWHGISLKKDLGFSIPLTLQQPDEQALKEFEEAEQSSKKRGKGAAKPDQAASFVKTAFARRFIVNLAEDAIGGFLRDSKASRIGEAKFSEQGLTEVWVRHGSSSYDIARLALADLSEEQQQAVISELKADPHALAQLQTGTLDEAFAKRLQERGIPLMCGDDPGDSMECTCESSECSVCRHEIALLRRTAQRIESDPGLLFALRGFDIKAELKKLGAGSGAASAWMKAEKLLTIHPELDAKDDGDKTPEDALHHLNRVSFAKAPSGLLHSAFTLLAPSPSGYAGDDCKAALLKTLDCARECVRAMVRSDVEVKSLPDFTVRPAEITAEGRLYVTGTHDAIFRITRETADAQAHAFMLDFLKLSEEKLQQPKYQDLVLEFKGKAYSSPLSDAGFAEMHSLISGCFNGKIPAQVLEDSGLAGQALYALCSIARKLVLADAIMPCPLRLSPEKLCVIWIPCLLSHEVLTLTARIGMLAKKLLLGTALVPGRSLAIKGAAFSDAGFGALCLGLFISDLVHKGFLMNLGLAVSVWNRTLANTPELMLMTLSYWENLNLSDAAMQRMDSSLGQWLAPMFLGLTGMRPVLILGTSFEPDLSIDAAEEKLRESGRQAPEEELSGEKAAKDGGGLTDPDAQPEADDKACAEISLGFIDRADGRYLSYGEVGGLGAQKRGECRAAAARIAALLPEAAGIVSGESDHAELSLDALQKALFEILPALKLSGALVVLPRSMRRILRPRAVANLKLGRSYKGGNGLMSLTALLSFDWKAALGGREITEKQFAALEKHAGHLVRFGNDFVFASPDEIDAIIKRLRGEAQRPSRLKLLEAALSGSFEGDEVFMDGKIKEAIQKELRTPPAKVPEGLAATLRPYQERGYSWLMHNLRARMGSVIADDMGLGKTVQVIAALEALREAGELDENPALVAVPASVVINWEREIKRFAPKLTVSVYYGTERSLKQKAQVLLTTYGTLRQDIDKIKELKWRVAVADEAQNIKNPLSQIFRDMCALKADSAIAMTGTPVENRLADYWAIMEFVNPGLFGTLGSFTAGYAQPIERERDAEAARRLRDVTAPFILRRLKTDKNVIADLPDKLSADRFCELTPEQAAMYQSFVTDGLRGVTETLTPIERSAQVLRLILRLKQICDAPELFSKDPRISGPAHSGKAQALLDLLQELCENGRKAIVFTQFREMGDLLVSWIGERLGTAPDFIHGGVSVKKRQEMVDRFQNDPRDRVMVLSLKAAGTGLNLTAAAAVVHYDLWWNPAVEDQATDRAYRIGQDKNVEVYRFICAGTFEEKINEMIRSKKEIAELTVQKGEKWLGDLSKSELKSFLSMSAG
ncbi:MAG: DEAD/DEAH box helicase [Succinivibrio sp.]|nr:DEAD/DEAH box helicase [Succinivibrio sp.]